MTGLLTLSFRTLLFNAQINWDKERFDHIVKSLSTFLQNAGYRPKNLRFVPVSGMTGINLEKTGGVEEGLWYSGPSLVEAIGTC